MIEFFRAWFSWWIFGLHFGWWKFRNKGTERALVMERQGVFYELEFAHRIYVGELGEMFAYGDDGVAYVFNERVGERLAKLTKEEAREAVKAIVDAEIRAEVTGKRPSARRNAIEKMEIYEDERILFVVDGEVVTSPVSGTGTPMEKHILSNFNRGDAMRQLSDSFRISGTGLGWGSLKYFLLIGAVALIMFLVWKFVFKGHLPGAATPTPTPTPTPGASPIYSASQWAMWVISNA